MIYPQSYLTTDVAFEANGNHIAGCLCLPTNTNDPVPIVIYVMGSGPADRNGYSSLPPLWDAFAQIGIASLAWDKPGVGGSSGDWHYQTHLDRANEAVAAVQFARTLPQIDPTRIAMWGISQAGWVMPTVCALTDEIHAMIAVSVPVGTGAAQELYRVRVGFPVDGFTQAETEQAVAFTKERIAMMQQGQPFTEIEHMQNEITARWKVPLGSYTQADYDFLKAAQDHAPDAEIKQIRCPVLALFGERDNIVDWRAAAEFYRTELPRTGNSDVTVKIFPHADHVLFYSETGSSAELDASFSASIKRFTNGYLETMTTWLSAKFRL